MSIEFDCPENIEFDSLGLVSYNNGDRVCTFVDNDKFLDNLSSCIVLVLTNKEVAPLLREKYPNIDLCIVENPRLTYFLIHQHLVGNKEYERKTFNTIIGKNCNISKMACIAEENVIIGDNVTIEEFCTIKPNTVIGNNSVIRSGNVIGAEGFEIKTMNEDYLFVVKHLGGVIIGENVEIQHNCCINKAIYPWDNTILGDNVKVDDLVHMGHGVKIDKRTKVVTHTVVGGRTKVGKDVWLGIGCLIRNGMVIGDNARVNMGAVVTRNVEAGASVTGNFAVDHRKFLENLKKIR